MRWSSRDRPVRCFSAKPVATTPRGVALAMASRDLIRCAHKQARTARYVITEAGRAHLARLTGRTETPLDDAAPFGAQRGSDRDALAEDARDLELFDERANEPTVEFEDFVKGLKRDGTI